MKKNKTVKQSYSLPMLRLLALCWMGVPVLAHAALELTISEASAEKIAIEIKQSASDSACPIANEAIFRADPNTARVSDTRYTQELNSEIGEDANYLKAARMGGGIYVHLPYFFPAVECKDVVFEVNARHILWGGKWHSGQVRFTSAEARYGSIFFTNEVSPVINGASYFDANIPAPTMKRLDADFSRILRYYQDVLQVNPMQGVGSVVAVVHNKGNYTGYGGDSLNVIRMSYDNPSPENLLTLDKIFPPIFAHELAHKLQSERLFALPQARHVVEGSADFFHVLVLHSAGLMDQEQTKRRVLKAAAECTAAADGRTLSEKTAQQAIGFREPYDCGMTYYYASFYTSGLTSSEFVALLRKALSGEKNYSDKRNSLCLLYEDSCTNARLNAIVGNKESYVRQVGWLENELNHPPILLSIK